jgi:hypothetical protein
MRLLEKCLVVCGQKMCKIIVETPQPSSTKALVTKSAKFENFEVRPHAVVGMFSGNQHGLPRTQKPTLNVWF